MTDGPLIVQSDKTLLLDIDHPLSTECRRAIAPFAERYSLTYNKKKILGSLEEDQIMFDPDEAERLFNDAGVLFQGQIKRDFQQLIAFNRAITDERRIYLTEERTEIESEIKLINSELNELAKISLRRF